MTALREFSDVSHWEASVAWSLYHDDEIGLKATQGEGVDPTYLTRVKAAHAKKIAVHHYDFGQHVGVVEQARFFVATVAPHWLAGDFATIDAEQAGFNGADVETWQDEVHRLNPHWQQEIYGSPSYLEANSIRPKYGALLWLAEYGVKAPRLPKGFTRWDRWQFTSTDTIPAIAGKSDRSYIAATVKPTPKPASKQTPLNRVTRALIRKATRLLERIVRRLGKRRRPTNPAGLGALASLATLCTEYLAEYERIKKL